MALPGKAGEQGSFLTKRCEKCGAQMRVPAQQTFECPSCGTKWRLVLYERIPHNEYEVDDYFPKSHAMGVQSFVVCALDTQVCLICGEVLPVGHVCREKISLALRMAEFHKTDRGPMTIEKVRDFLRKNKASLQHYARILCEEPEQRRNLKGTLVALGLFVELSAETRSLFDDEADESAQRTQPENG